MRITGLMLGAASCIFILSPSLPAQSQPPSSLIATTASWLEQIRPELEKTLGYTLPKLPRLQESALREAPDPDMVAHLHWRFPHLKDELLARAIDDARAVNNSAALARLVDGTNVILIRPESQKRLADFSKDPSGCTDPDFLKLAVLHETVRYALDTRYNLPRHRRACHDAEEWFAWQALVEGRAQDITRRLALKLGMEKSFPLLAERWLHAPDVSPDPGLRTTSQSAVRQLHWACTRGRQFFEYLQERDMPDMESRVFTQPPRLVQWVENPELYLRARQAPGRDLATTVTKLEGKLPAAQWQVLQQAWTPAMAVQAAQLFLDKQLVEKRVAGWQEGRSLVWSHKTSPGRLTTLSVARFQSPNAARSFFNFTLDLNRKIDETMKVASSRSRELRLPSVDEAILCERSLGGQTSWALRVRRGEQFIEVVWYGGAADLAFAEALLQGLQ